MNNSLKAFRLRRIGAGAGSPFVGSVEELAKDNEDFRRVLYTGPELQLVLMTLPKGGDIGMEVHARVEQAIDVVQGEATAILDGKKHALKAGDTVVIPPGTEHNIVNAGDEPLRLFTVYSPPNHPPGTVHATKQDAEADSEDEAFSAKANKK